jgi:hypothetical protein
MAISDRGQAQERLEQQRAERVPRVRVISDDLLQKGYQPKGPTPDVRKVHPPRQPSAVRLPTAARRAAASDTRGQ